MNADHAGFLKLLAPASPDAGGGHFGLAERADIRENARRGILEGSGESRMAAGDDWHKHAITREEKSFLAEESFPSTFAPRGKARFGLAQEFGSDTSDCPQPGVDEAAEVHDPAAFLLRIIEDSEVSKRLGSVVPSHRQQHESVPTEPTKHNADVSTFEQPLARVPSRESTRPSPPEGIQSYPKLPDSALAGDEPETILPRESSEAADGLGAAAIPGIARPRRRGAEEVSNSAAESATSGSLPATPMRTGSRPPDPALLTMSNAPASKDRLESEEEIATLLSAMEDTEIAKSLGVVARSEKGAARPSAEAGPSMRPAGLRVLEGQIDIPVSAKWVQPETRTERQTEEAVEFDAAANRVSPVGAEDIPKKESKPASPEAILPLRSIIGGRENPTLTDQHDSTTAEHAETPRDTSEGDIPDAVLKAMQRLNPTGRLTSEALQANGASAAVPDLKIAWRFEASTKPLLTASSGAIQENEPGPTPENMVPPHEPPPAAPALGRSTETAAVSAASEPAAAALPGESRSEASAPSVAPSTSDSLTVGVSQQSQGRSDEAPAFPSPEAAVDPPRLQMLQDGSPILRRLSRLGGLSRLVQKTTRLTSKHLDRAEFHLETQFERWFEPPDPRRRSRRLAKPPLVAYYWPADDPKAHEIADISFGGLHLLTQDRWPEGSIFSMCLQRTDTEKGEPGSWIAVDFRIVHWCRDGVAGAFLPSSNMTYADAGRANNCVDRKTLESFVKRLVGRARR